MKTLHAATGFLVKELGKQYDELTAHQHAWWLLEALLDMPAIDVCTTRNLLISDAEWEMLRGWLHEHLVKHKPLAYILGWIPFYDLHINVRPPILIPRPETEEWSVRLIGMLRGTECEELQILDMCAGSGCIGLLLAHIFPQSSVTAVDINSAALALVRENAQYNDIANVVVIESDLFAQLQGQKFDIIVSNPPYIGHDEWETLAPSVREWEDPHALISENHGLEIITRIITEAPNYLRGQKKACNTVPSLVLEVGHTQAGAVEHLMQQHGYRDIRIWRDVAGHERVVCGTL
jgi:release factor glutamine methyltransferase